ncbi:hypothetical protein B0H14DRAFT_2609397 [Mycena olivaceomarginata]|nr:hypothetical protein B0H14DRAFT_2609397 [Mycena olivaceomarginata]
MPRQLAVTQFRLENIIASLGPAVTLLKDLNDAFCPPFVQPIINIIEASINVVQNVKRNKNNCAQLMENIHQVLYAIVHLHIKSETVGSLPPEMINNIGKFMETLHKIYTYIQAQQDGNKIKNLFRNTEIQNLLKDCQSGLDQAMEVFRAIPDATTGSDRSSPQIFHGRETELSNIMGMLDQQSPRIAILGGGGMGKTSLARAVLHHPDISTKFEYRVFVSAESATTGIELAALIGLNVGLDPGQDLIKPVVQYFSKQLSSLLILDNLETVWEPIQSRGGVEEVLSLLTEVEHLTLIITMRGAEKPAKVRWTHPFLLPLQPLSDDAAQQTFMDITDNIYQKEDIHQILQFTDNMPLAVDLIAHLADYEGLSNVLTRWETEKTALLSVGNDRKSNLDVSISLSLSSPRITSDSKELLGLLSILPNGISDSELVQSNILIPNILSCKASLLATSLAYQDSNKRLRSLMPVREHIQQFLPPAQPLVHAFCKYLSGFLELYQNYNGEQLQPVVNQVTSNLGNLQELLQRELHDDTSNLVDTIYCIIIFNSFCRVTRGSHTLLMDQVQPILPRLCDSQLEIHFIIEFCKSYEGYGLQDQWITRGIALFEHLDSPLLESKFYNTVADYFFESRDLSQAMLYYQKALELSKLCENTSQQCHALQGIARLKYRAGDYSAGQVVAAEAQRLARLSADSFEEAAALWIGAGCSTYLGDFHHAIAQSQRGREILGICGLAGGILDHNITMSEVEIHVLKSEYTQARKIYSQIVETSSADEDIQQYGFALLNLAHIDVNIGGDVEDIYQKLNKAKAIFSTWPREIVQCGTIQAVLELRQEKFDLAKAKFQESLHAAWGKYNDVESLCLERLADIGAWPTSKSQMNWPVIYLGYASKSKEKLALYKAFLFLGDVFIVNRDECTATNLYTIALDGFTYMDVHCSRAQCMLRLGDLAESQTYTSEAIKLWKTARPLFEQSLQAKEVAKIDARLLTVEKGSKRAMLELATLYASVRFGNEEAQGVAPENFQESPVSM